MVQYEMGEMQVTLEEGTMTWQQEQDSVEVFEPIVAKQDCQLDIVSAERAVGTSTGSSGLSGPR